MLKHFVFIRYQKDVPTEQTDAFCQSMYQLSDKIPEILALEIGKNTAHSDNNWDLTMLMLFQDESALQRCQGHPDYQSVLQDNDQYASDIACIGYEKPVKRHTEGSLASELCAQLAHL